MTQQNQDQKHEGWTEKAFAPLTNQQQEPELTRDATVRERPILFSGEMVRAILDGRKTQTRRVVKCAAPMWEIANLRAKDAEWVGIPAGAAWPIFENVDGDWLPLACPYGQPGDRLWVRETWGLVTMHSLTTRRLPRDQIVYRAGKQMGIPVPGSSPIEFHTEWRDDFQPARWRPSIHMPRIASRLTLEITGIRVEPVQDISEADARAEGITEDFPEHECNSDRPFAEGYRRLWDALNAKRGYSWDSNPWVFVIEFCRLPVSERREGTKP